MSKKKKIILVAGARPNFMKIAPILRALEEEKELFEPVVVHTGQHYDSNMSDTFFDELGIKKPDYNLGAGSASQAVQTAKIMVEFEKVCIKEKPDAVLVVGDVNSTIAAGLVAKKLDIMLGHVEAGLRSYDRKMPEEINRIATDAISDLFFVTEKSGIDNLLKEGIDEKRIFFCGHVMIDNLFYQLDKIAKNGAGEFADSVKKSLPEKYFALTLHRPSNVDNPETLKKLILTLNDIAKEYPIVFPCHPRTMQRLKSNNMIEYFTKWEKGKKYERGILLFEPLGYNAFLSIWKDATAVITDSGGLQEETTALKVQCVTLRENTERPITVTLGTNRIVGTNPDKIKESVYDIVNGNIKKGTIPEKWDGFAGKRIVEILKTGI